MKNILQVVGVHDIITHANLSDDLLKGLLHSKGKIL